jgi:hypothetical protein
MFTVLTFQLMRLEKFYVILFENKTGYKKQFYDKEEESRFLEKN